MSDSGKSDRGRKRRRSARLRKIEEDEDGLGGATATAAADAAALDGDGTVGSTTESDAYEPTRKRRSRGKASVSEGTIAYGAQHGSDEVGLALIPALEAALEAAATVKTKDWWEAYMKHVIPFRGVKMADTRKALHRSVCCPLGVVMSTTDAMSQLVITLGPVTVCPSGRPPHTHTHTHTHTNTRTHNTRTAEVYKEDVRDRLSSNYERKLKVQQTGDGVVIRGLSQHAIASPADVTRLIAAGSRHRRVGTTDLNDQVRVA